MMQNKSDKLYSTLEAGRLLDINPKTIGAWIDRGFLNPFRHERIRNKKMAARLDYVNLIEIYLLNILGKFGLDLRFIADTIIKDFRADLFQDMENKLQFSWAKKTDDEVVIDIDPQGENKIRIYADSKKIIDGVKRKMATVFVNYTVVKRIIDEKIEIFKNEA